MMPHSQIQLMISVLRQCVSEFNPHLKISLRIFLSLQSELNYMRKKKLKCNFLYYSFKEMNNYLWYIRESAPAELIYCGNNIPANLSRYILSSTLYLASLFLSLENFETQHLLTLPYFDSKNVNLFLNN